MSDSRKYRALWLVLDNKMKNELSSFVKDVFPDGEVKVTVTSNDDYVSGKFKSQFDYV